MPPEHRCGSYFTGELGPGAASKGVVTVPSIITHFLRREQARGHNTATLHSSAQRVTLRDMPQAPCLRHFMGEFQTSQSLRFFAPNMFPLPLFPDCGTVFPKSQRPGFSTIVSASPSLTLGNFAALSRPAYVGFQNEVEGHVQECS